MFRYIAIIAIASAGIAHLAITPQHFSYALAHGIFFILLGVGQLFWAVAFWRYFSPVLYWAGLAGSGGTIVLWVLTQLISVPFAPEAAPVSPLLIMSKIAELTGFFALVVLTRRGMIAPNAQRPATRLMASALSVALAFGTGVWGGGHLAEAVAPGLGRESSRSHEASLKQGDRHPAHNVQVESTAVPIEAAPALDPTSEFEAIIADAVAAALADQRATAPTPEPASDLEAVIAAAVAAALTDQPTTAPAPDSTAEVEAIIAAAVAEALTNQPTITPTPDPASDHEAVIAAAVAAALIEQPTLTPEFGPTEAPQAHTDVGNGPGHDDQFTHMPVIDRGATMLEATPAAEATVAAQAPTTSVVAAPTPALASSPTATPTPTSAPDTASMPAPREGSFLRPGRILILGVIGVLIVISSIGVIRNW